MLRNIIWIQLLILILFFCSNCRNEIDFISYYEDDINTIIEKVADNFLNNKNTLPNFNKNNLVHFNKLIKISVKVLYAPEKLENELFENMIGKFSIDSNKEKLLNFYIKNNNGDYILKKDILYDDVEIITNLLNYSKYPKRKSYINTFDPFLLCTKEEFINSWDAYYYSIFENDNYRAPTFKHTISKTKTIKYSQRKVELFFGRLYLNHLTENAIKMNIDTINILLTEEINEYILKFSIMYYRS